jgi:AraC family transcriptional regulator
MASSVETTLKQSPRLLPASAPPIGEYRRGEHSRRNLETTSIVDISPPEIVKRKSSAWSGIIVETVEITRHEPFEYRFRAPYHLLIAAELAERDDGETVLEGLPRST